MTREGAATPSDHEHGGGPGPRVFDRLARDAQKKENVLEAPAWSRWVGWPLIVATMVVVVVAAVVVKPWG